MKEKKKKKKYEDTNVQKVFDESVISHKSPSPKVLTPKAQTSKVPKTCSASDIVFTSSSPIFTLHRAKLPAISTSSEEFCFYQDVFLLSQEENLNTEISNQFHKSFNPLSSTITFIDQSPLDPQTIPDNINTAKTLPRLSKNGKFLRRMFASPEESNISGSSFSHASKNTFSSAEFRRNCFRLGNRSALSSHTSTDSDSFYRKSPKKEEYLFAKGIKRSTAFHTAELLQEQLNADEEDDTINSNDSLVDKSENSVEAASLTSSEEREILSRPLRKSKGFHDQELLQQQIKEEDMSGVEVRRKILEEYVQHVYEIKLEHQLELEKVEEIYKQKLLEIETTQDSDVEEIVKAIRAEANTVLAQMRKQTLGNNVHSDV